MSLRTLLTTLLLTCSFSVVAATEVVQLNNRTSADLLPVAQNFIGRDGKVSAYGNQLIVNAELDKINELKALIAQLDTVPKRLLITVDTNENNQQNNADRQTQIITYSTDSREGGIQQVQTSEGTPALIQIGQSVPLTTTQTDTYTSLPNQVNTSRQPQNPLNNYAHQQNQTQYRNVTQGFYVTASVTGDIVHLAISTNRDRMSQERPDVVNVQSTDTTVSGRLGEWITLAGVNRQTQADKQAMSRSYSTQGRDDMTLRVKVDTLD
ncbi:elongation factor Ts [Pseudomonas sp. FW306-02-F02-AA]|uniref:Secretin n=1 Tax=Pseudomonas fluorescens TaxID=294 RepID=A0A0N7H113_PSEFL|nr:MULTISPECIES: secretin N-terminal domain-containing protein [Pseudomonas]ALI04660.1 secretin [Pseudomonas fluorescens]PMZ00924.1 elongation factor Ts [Pseudomonas sp. FW306-02-F02-AB]PMZ06760.1 elongation factor Ts [Pseudomonas sp. FW306-02-H06C]PMZ12381.1 elongation factor Ts [Pseudomonas sp. FW306-02-F02-AA]PMZ18569.1 elongation factor Ts [Pseudomonas sp. FW306-02-F08-AA]